MTTTNCSIDVLISKSERLGVIGSPSSTSELALDILGSAVNRKLVGELALFRYLQDTQNHFALGQITEVKLKNIWHEDPTMRSLIRQRGRVDAVSARQDTHLGQMVISAVFKEITKSNYEPSMLGTVPATGTGISLVSDEILDALLEPYKDQIFYLGRVYGSKPRLPLWFKHFDKGVDGAGEAYHLGIFGKTGSGKSVLAKMILMAYAKHPKMSLLVIDPQGEFARDIQNKDEGDFSLPLGEQLKKFKMEKNNNERIVVLGVRRLVLDRWELFKQILTESRFFRELQVLTREKTELASDQLTEAIKKAKGIKLTDLHSRKSFDKIWELLKQDKIRNKVYAKEGAAAERFKEAIDETNSDDIYMQFWLPIANLFKIEGDTRRKKIDDALNWLLNLNRSYRPVLIIDVSNEQAQGLLWNDKIQALVIKRLLEGVTEIAESLYKNNKSLNTLVVIDEAHRFAPRIPFTEDDVMRGVRSVLIDAARTTRKYGLGWLFISQTLSSIHPEILQQLRIMFFGFGLGLGQEFQSLRQLVGSSSTALDLYQLFRDPHSAFDTESRQYSFMTIGPVSPLSFSGTPLFFNAFNKVDDFLKHNKLDIS